VYLQASELVAVKSKADEIISQKAALDDHINTLKVAVAWYMLGGLTFLKLMMYAAECDDTFHCLQLTLSFC